MRQISCATFLSCVPGRADESRQHRSNHAASASHEGMSDFLLRKSERERAVTDDKP